MSTTIASLIEITRTDTWAERRPILADRFRAATEVPMLIVSVFFLVIVVLPDIVDH